MAKWHLAKLPLLIQLVLPIPWDACIKIYLQSIEKLFFPLNFLTICIVGWGNTLFSPILKINSWDDINIELDTYQVMNLKNNKNMDDFFHLYLSFQVKCLKYFYC